jgi:type IV pilus assembly protein PilC
MAKKDKKQNPLNFLFKERVTKKTKEMFFENLGLMISSGIDIVVALDILKTETKSKGIKLLIAKVQEDISNGHAIWESLEKSQILPKHLISVVRIGEESGKLSENLVIVVKQMQKQREFRSKIRSASLYPSFVLVLMVAVGLVMSIFVLPRLTTIYKSLDTDLPLITQVLIGFGEFIQNYGMIAIPAAILVLVILFVVIFIDPKTKFIGQWILFKLPVVKRMLMEVEVSRFGFLMGTLLESGFPILDAIDLLEYSTELIRYKKFYRALRFSINEGFSFHQSMDRYKWSEKVLPAYARQLLISSEKSGNLAQALKNIGLEYEKRNDTTIKDFSVLIEPLLLVLVWIGVAFIALAVVMPIYSLVGNITDLSGGTTNQTVDETIQEETVNEVDLDSNIQESEDVLGDYVSYPIRYVGNGE